MSLAPRRIRLVLAYDGTDFLGWQVQPSGRTVQGEVEKALARLHGGEAVAVRGAGRTDAGVHAIAQVADAEVRIDRDDAGVLRSLRGLLPADVRVVRVETVPASFHSRHDAVSKTYAYRIDRTGHGNPFLARFALHHPGRFRREAVLAALARLPGRREWTGFAGSAAVTGSKIRHLMEAAMEESAGSLLTFTFTADGFLNHMVRNLVGTVLEIGRGRFAPERIDDILASGDRSLAGPTAPARGLCLERVGYDEPGPDEEPEAVPESFAAFAGCR